MAYRDDELKNPEKIGSKTPIFNRSLTVHSSELPKTSSFYPLSPFIERSLSVKKLYSSPLESMVFAGNSIKGKVKKLCSYFEPPQKAPQNPSNLQPLPLPPLSSPGKTGKLLKSESFSASPFRLPGTDDRVVIYVTSLRGIRRTFEDCYTVRMILRGYRVKIDERDISMDNAYKKELHSALGEKNVTLPQIFIKGKYIGGAEVIKQLNEAGELSLLLRGIRVLPPGYTCEGCGDVRFLPCSNCDGSRKLFDEDEGVLRRCTECNENGLVRCPVCCS